MFKNLSIKTKTFFLSLILMGVLIAIGGVSMYALDHLGKSLTTVSMQSLPAVRNMTLVDMMHDGVRAVVYRSLLASTDEKASVEEEYKEFSENISLYIANIEKLGLDQKLNDEIKKSHPAIVNFQESGRKVVTTAMSGDKDGANLLMPAFMKSFEELEVRLETLGEMIEAEATKQSEQGQKYAADLTKLTLYMVIAGLLISVIVSFLAYKFISGLTTNLASITSGLKDEATQIVDTSKNMATVAGRLSEASTEQAASLQETVASLDEISAMITRNADSAASSARMSEESTVIAQKGKEKTEIMMESINSIAEGNDEIILQMQKSNEQISDIVKVIQNIGQKTQVINDIVFQTKLLSFNASVEAARAGEHGKGFSVVAEEVGNLASMSGNAATEITSMLNSSIKHVTDIVDGTKGLMDNLIRKSREKVNFGTETAKQCKEALDEILANVSSVNEMVREISTASQEQSTGVVEVNKAMSELDQVTQSNSGIAHDSSKAANGLNLQAERLNSLVAELTRLTGGQSVSSVQPQRREEKKKAVAVDNVVHMKKSSPAVEPKKSTPAPTKKVSGLEFEAPRSDDSRFEDI